MKVGIFPNLGRTQRAQLRDSWVDVSFPLKVEGVQFEFEEIQEGNIFVVSGAQPELDSETCILIDVFRKDWLIVVWADVVGIHQSFRKFLKLRPIDQGKI